MFLLVIALPGAPAETQRFDPGSRSLRWECGPVLIEPAPSHPSIAYKDPSVVFAKGRWHVYATDVGRRPHQLVYLSFTDWKDAPHAEAVTVRVGPKRDVLQNATAPHVFYYRPHRRWYLFYGHRNPKSNLPSPTFSVLPDVDQPEKLSAPECLFDQLPASLPESRLKWLDFWVIADDSKVHLFFTNDDGFLLRCETTPDRFPRGWSDPATVLREGKNEVFEGSCTYRLGPDGKFLTLVEAIDGRNRGSRYFRAYLADQLGGPWRSLEHTAARPFAGLANVSFAPGVTPWTHHISHGEMVRDGTDERMLLDLSRPRFLFQGCAPEHFRPPDGKGYHHMAWRLGLLEAKP